MIRCVVYRNLLTAVVLAGDEPGWPLGSHTGQCIRCQAHVASLRATRRRLAELGNERITAPVGFESQVMDSLENPAEPPVQSGRWVRAAGASMAAALLAAVWMRRRAVART
jgi:anti-sigma factor RsiW